jgi:hypothetical protein
MAIAPVLLPCRAGAPALSQAGQQRLCVGLLVRTTGYGSHTILSPCRMKHETELCSCYGPAVERATAQLQPRTIDMSAARLSVKPSDSYVGSCMSSVTSCSSGACGHCLADRLRLAPRIRRRHLHALQLQHSELRQPDSKVKERFTTTLYCHGSLQ